MKKFINTLAVIGAFALIVTGVKNATAETEAQCMGLGLPGPLAEALCGATSVSGAIIPDTDDSYDLGSASLEFQDGFFDGTVTTDALVNSGASTLTGAVGFGSTLIGTGTATIGWAVVAGANTACTTTCTTPCVFGVNTAATEADIVDCADATADECLCAGAS